MIYETVRSDNTSRFSEVQVYLNHIASLEPRLPTDTVSLEVKIMRGLFYVHLYAAIEKSINEIVQRTLLSIGSMHIKDIHYTLNFNAVTKMDKIKSINDCSARNILTKSVELFKDMSSRQVSSINETMFADKLQNIWMKRLEEILSAFGIYSLDVDSRERATINEIVDLRNAVAHGRESAVNVGTRNNSNVLRSKLEVSQDVIDKVIDEFEDFYNNKKYLKPVAKKFY